MAFPPSSFLSPFVQKILLWAALFFSMICFGAGIFLPVLHVTQLYLFADEITIWGSIGILWQDQEFFLSLLIILFTLCLPLLKYALILSSFCRIHIRRGADLLHALGKWSMLDVFILAMVLVMMKSSILADAHTGAGLYTFTAAIFTQMILLRQIEKKNL